MNNDAVVLPFSTRSYWAWLPTLYDRVINFWDDAPLCPILTHIIAKVFHLSSPQLYEFGKLAWDNEMDAYLPYK